MSSVTDQPQPSQPVVSVDNPLATSLVYGTTTERPCPHCPGNLTIQVDDDGHELPDKPAICRHCHTTPDGQLLADSIEFGNSTDEYEQYDDEHYCSSTKYVQNGVVPYWRRRESWYDDTDDVERDSILDQ